MTPLRRWLLTAALLVFTTAAASGQGAAVTPQQATPFMGTWVFTMTEPEHFKGSQQTVRIWNQNGRVVASIQIGKFPANNVTGVHKDGDMLVLTISYAAQPPIMENGVPLLAVILLTLDGDAMRMAQMLERSQTIKRGTGKEAAP
jgi:uncharacterized membrane protein YhhN